MIRSATSIVLLAFIAEAQPKSVRLPHVGRRTALRRPVPLNFGLPQELPNLSSKWMRPEGPLASGTWDPLASVNTGAEVPFVRATAAGAVVPDVRAAEAATNVFGEQLQGCENEGDLCSFSGEDPTVCVRTGKFTMRFYCKSIWDTNWKPFRKTGGEEIPPGEQLPAAGDTTKCEAISSEVLDSQYSKDVYDNFWTSVKVSKYTEVNRPGMGAMDSVSTMQVQEVPKKSARARRFRKSIDFICRTCALYAESESAKDTLDSKCKAMGWNLDALDEPPPLKSSSGRGAVEKAEPGENKPKVPEAATTANTAEASSLRKWWRKLVTGDENTRIRDKFFTGSKAELFDQNYSGIFAAALTSLLVGCGVTLVVLRFRRRASTEGERRLLAD